MVLSSRSRMPTPLRRFVRTLVAVALAVVASARGGGVALACEAATVTDHASMVMGDVSMPEHDGRDRDGCGEPERVRECALMAACAPAIFAASPDTGVISSSSAALLPWRSRIVTPVDRSPEPPPPRA